MSEENEHTSEETESEMNTENHSKEQSKSESSMLNNETGQPLLEDEEMPTYISVSSPSRREDSDVNNTKQQEGVPLDEEHSRSPYPSDDQGAGSIYVLSSGEESNHPYNYEEEDEYADSEDMDEMDLENDEHENVMLEDEEEEDEDDDDDVNPLRLHNDDDEDMDTEYDQECFDRASDDFILNNRIKQHHKERSLSLQDLSFSKNNIHSPFNKKRHSLNIFRHNYLGMQQSPMVYPIANKKQMVPLKYQHVESKVKHYIRGIKEQSRRSIEKRAKEQELATNKYREENENNGTAQLKAMTTCKTIKDYAEKALNDLQEEENEHDCLTYNAVQIVENGENNKTLNKITGNQYKHLGKDTDIQSDTYTQNCDDKVEKRNGSINVNTHRIEYQNTLDKNARLNNANESSLINGHQETSMVVNLYKFNYEEYVQDTPNNEQGEELNEQRQQKTNETGMYNEAEMINTQDIDNSNASCPLKIENVKSIRLTQNESETVNFAKVNLTDKVGIEHTELIELKAQLSQKDTQFLNLRDAYQKIWAENLKMKQELDAVRKSLAKYENERKSCETKVACVQTEKVVEPISNQNTATLKEVNNKISTSSVASTASSTDHWSDSVCSPAISIKPPDLTPILNSDDSIVLTNAITPRKLSRPISRTFITSSRILQTLSNITQGKTKVESPLVRNPKESVNENSTEHLLNLECNSPIYASSSKKRKATDMLGSSTFVQPFKIPHVTVEPERKLNSDITEVELNYSDENTTSKNDKQENTSTNKNINGSTSAESKTEETGDNEDNVKCFIYRDHENSKNRSFLIQAEEPTKDRLENGKNRIQECGPYLLGNLEVRMSEINGTISVWGKEVNHEHTSDNEDDVEVSIKSGDRKSCQFWPNLSHGRFNGSPLLCSTNKKQKIPLRLNRSNTSQCCQSISLNSVKTTPLVDDINDQRHTGTACSPNANIHSCEYHKDCSTCKGVSHSEEKLHSCCMHHTEIISNECNCSYHERQKYDVNSRCCKDKFYSKGNRRSSCKNISDSRNHSQANMNATAEVNDLTCRYHTTCRRALLNVTDTNPHSKCCNIIRDVPCTCQSCTDNTNRHDNSDRHTCNSLSNDGEEDPLIPFKRSNETLTTRQRRLSGKRVRGILMDLLRGCGDCRSNTNTGLSKHGTQQKGTPHATNGASQIKVSLTPTPEPTCSNSTQLNDRCCHAYARRIESLLEEFRTEMERVRSRSDAILDMLNVLHSVDMN